MHTSPRLRRLLFLLIVSSLVAGGDALALPTREQIAAILSPPRISHATLSPDGARLAYVAHETRSAIVCIRDVPSGETRATALVGIAGAGRRRQVRVSWLAWTDAGTVAFAAAAPDGDGDMHAVVRTLDLHGVERTLLTGDDVSTLRVVDAEHPDPNSSGWDRPDRSIQEIPRVPRVIGLSASEPGVLLIEASGNDLTDLFALDVGTGRLRVLHREERAGRYIYDWDGNARLLETPRIRVPAWAPRMSPGTSEVAFRSPAGPTADMALPYVTRQFWYHRPSSGGRWRQIPESNAETPLGLAHDDADFYGHRTLPLGFARDPNVLYVASNMGRDVFGIYEVDTRTWERGSYQVESADADLVSPRSALSTAALVFDRDHTLVGVRQAGHTPTTSWRDAALARVHEELQRRFAGRAVNLIDWTATRDRVLFSTEAAHDPRRFFLYEAGAPPRLTELLRNGYNRYTALASTALPFSFTHSSGVHLCGTITVPRVPRATPPALLVRIRDYPGPGFSPTAFNRQSQALAAFGYMVLDLNHRGLEGHGLQHLRAPAGTPDRAPIEDIRVAIEWLRQRHAFHPRRVALLGEGTGGFVALRALQLHPAEFRCAVAINSPTDLRGWLRRTSGNPATERGPWAEQRARCAAFFSGSDRDLDAISVLSQADAMPAPVLLSVDPGLSPPLREQVEELARRLRGLGREVELLRTSLLGAGDDPDAAARLYFRLAGFLNEHVYEYRVDVGAEKEVP